MFGTDMKEKLKTTKSENEMFILEIMRTIIEKNRKHFAGLVFHENV
jgi:hypothetical protein